MKYYLQFLFNIQVLLVIMTSFDVWFSYLSYLELDSSDNDYYIKSYFFFYSCVCFLVSWLIIFFSFSNKFLNSLFSDSYILNFLVLVLYFSFIYFLTMRDSYTFIGSFIGFLIIGYLSIMNILVSILSRFQKEKNINVNKFFFIKGRFNKKIIKDEFVFESKHNGISYANEHVIFHGKIINNKDIEMLEESFRKKIYDLSEEEKMTVFMYAIS